MYVKRKLTHEERHTWAKFLRAIVKILFVIGLFCLWCVLCHHVLCPALAGNLDKQTRTYVSSGGSSIAYAAKGVAKSGILAILGGFGGLYEYVVDPAPGDGLAFAVYIVFFTCIFPNLLGAIFLPTYLQGGIGGGLGGGGSSGGSHSGGGGKGH